MITLGDDASPDQIRRLLTRIDLRQCTNELGQYVSPVTGEIFESFYQLAGHIGARLRTVHQSPLTEDRSGYVKALRRGITPTETQTRAHREYQRAYRAKKRQEAAST